MKEKTINIIGAGNLGKTVARLIVNHSAGSIAGVCNASFESSSHAVKFIGAGAPCQNLDALPPSDITFITVPDDQIMSVCEMYSRSANFNPSGTIIHCSGLLTSDALVAARKKGCHVMSVHPMRSFADPELSVKNFAGTYCAVEGEASSDAENAVFEILNAIGAKIIPINKHKKGIYHAAGVLASNYVVTLADIAMKCLRDSGVGNEDATSMVLSLMEGTLGNLAKTRSPEAALTGPIKRGDVGTIRKHMAALEDEQIKTAYAALGELTLQLTSHEMDRKKEIQSALQDHHK